MLRYIAAIIAHVRGHIDRSEGYKKMSDYPERGDKTKTLTTSIREPHF
jgi:hypothetical protein